MIIAGLAEGPGGFIEAILNFRANIVVKKIIFMLQHLSQPIKMYRLESFIIYKKTLKNIKISYGADETGNIYDLRTFFILKQLVIMLI